MVEHLHIPGHVIVITVYPSTNYNILGLATVQSLFWSYNLLINSMEVVINKGCTVLGHIHCRGGWTRFKRHSNKLLV